MDFPSYLSSLREVFLSDPREESYYAPLKDLLESAGVKVLIAPSKTSAGFPDLKVFQEDGFIVGYVEGKPPREDLTKVIDSEQIKRYLSHFPNLLLTNFIEFVHFLNGKPTGRAELIAIEDLERGNFKKAKIEETKQLLTNFLNYIQKPITSTQELAKALSWRVRLLKEEIRAELERNQTLKDLFNQIKEYIIHNMSEEDFSDTIAQALAYALLIIRTRREYIRKEEVLTQIPQSLSIVRDIFLEIFRIEGKDIEWILDEIENTLNLFDPRENSLTPEELTIHFYEPFLREYNPDLREIRGVYYTPKPVVSFIVRSVEKALRSSFGFNGYVEETLKLLDPAGGTLTFILETLYRVREEVVETFGEGAVKDYFERVVLENFYAFELLPAPYVIGHLKVGKFLSDLGIEDRKFKLYLTNTLELKHAQIPYLFSHEWAKEIQSADRVKTQENILVVIGNPPYSGISANNQKDIVEFLKKDVDGCQSYYRVDGKDLKTFLEELSRTKKVKVWLQDDYVKFIRFAQWKIERSGKGVVGYITNHSYIDNPTFAGMRQSLLKTFDRIYILDLHGNKRKKEPDENVFDIQQGVAIGIFVKDGSREGEYGEVYYYSTLENERLLNREEKFEFLEKNAINTISWHRVEPKSPFYFFKPIHRSEEYERAVRLTDIFNKFVSGIVTARDNLVIGFTAEEVREKIKTFLDESVSDEEIRRRFKVNDNYAWKLSEARKKLKEEIRGKDLDDFIKPILYRPFDVRYIFYHPTVVFRMRDLMPHMLKGENLGLITMNQVSLYDENYNHVFITQEIVDNRVFSSSKGIAYLFPLYLYTDEGKRVNFTKNFREYLKSLYGKEPPAEEVLYYIYAVLYDPEYREKYKEELRYNFPRIPFPERYEKFQEIAKIGKKLVKLHLLEDSSLKTLSTRFKGEGNNEVKKITYRDGKVYINESQYFYPVEKEVWEYRIGGYQVPQKWLSDRKGRRLSFEDIKTYLMIVRAIEETIKLQKTLRGIWRSEE